MTNWQQKVLISNEHLFTFIIYYYINSDMIYRIMEKGS